MILCDPVLPSDLPEVRWFEEMAAGEGKGAGERAGYEGKAEGPVKVGIVEICVCV